MCEDDKRLAEQLVAARKDAGLSQEALSEKLYVTRQAVSNWERGRTRPSQEMIERIAGALGVSVERMVGMSHDAEQRMNFGEDVAMHDYETISSDRAVHVEQQIEEVTEMQEKRTKKTFSRQSVLIGLGYAIGFFLGFTLFFVTGLLVMQPMVWAAALFGGIGVFFLVGLTIHFIILLKAPFGPEQ